MSIQRIGLGLLLLGLVLTPLLGGDFHVTLMSFIGLSSLVVLGLVLLTGIGGLTSFGQAAFVGLGAYATAYLSTTYGASPWWGLLAGLVLTLGVAYVLAKLTLGLAGHYLPLGTMAWGLSLYFVFGNLEVLGSHTGIGGIAPLSIMGFELSDKRHFYAVIWFAMLMALWGLSNLLDTRVGRAIRSLKGGSLMAEAMGVDTQHYKLMIFLIAAALASVSGWLYAHMQRFVSPAPFGLNLGIEYLFMAVIGGAGYLWGALAGATVFTLLKQLMQDLSPRLLGSTGNFEMVVFGLLMILILQRARGGLWPLVGQLFPARKPTSTLYPLQPRPERRSEQVRGTILLNAERVTKRFGGLVANHQIDLNVKAGEIVALIGPNGAGKSTFFNCISGVAHATEGMVQFIGQDVTRRSSREIAQMGMSRTFQHVRMLHGMSVLENVAIGGHQRGRKGLWASVFHAERQEERSLMAEAAAQIERVGLSAQTHEPAGNLALGQQRIMEIARALCTDPSLLLLDEPAAGLRHLEKQTLAQLLRTLRDDGIGILLVEHDMDFVMGLADRVVVMDFGQKIAEGRPDEVQIHPRVREAYLGAAV